MCNTPPERESIDVAALRTAARADELAQQQRARELREQRLRDIGWPEAEQ
jgi:hypothetical protein